MAKTPRTWTGARNPSGLKRVRASKRRHEILAPRRTQAKTLVKKALAVATTRPEGADPQAALAAFTVKGQADGVNADIEAALKEPGVEEVTANYRGGDRLVKMERCDYLRPTIVHCASPEAAMAKKEYMFPFATVVECPQDKMLESIGPTLVGTGITENEKFIRELTDATHIDRLNIGPIPTIKLDWLQPHEGNIVDFLFRARAYQVPPDRLATLNR